MELLLVKCLFVVVSLLVVLAPAILIIGSLIHIFRSPERKGSIRGTATVLEIKKTTAGPEINCQSYCTTDDYYYKRNIRKKGRRRVRHQVLVTIIVSLMLPDGKRITEKAKIAEHAGMGIVSLFVGSDVPVCFFPNRHRNHKIRILSQAYLDRKSGKTKSDHQEMMRQAKVKRKAREESIRCWVRGEKPEDKQKA